MIIKNLKQRFNLVLERFQIFKAFKKLKSIILLERNEISWIL